MSKNSPRSACPIAFALDRFGDKWSLLIIRDLVFMGKNTYGEFLESSEEIATNILADRLKRLEADGIISKSRDPENGRRMLYSLTDKGLDLVPVLLSMVQWSARHDPHTGAPKELLQRLEDDPEGFVEEIRSRLKK